jgi:hypothetical protein
VGAGVVVVMVAGAGLVVVVSVDAASLLPSGLALVVGAMSFVGSVPFVEVDPLAEVLVPGAGVVVPCAGVVVPSAGVDAVRVLRSAAASRSPTGVPALLQPGAELVVQLCEPVRTVCQRETLDLGSSGCRALDAGLARGALRTLPGLDAAAGARGRVI